MHHFLKCLVMLGAALTLTACINVDQQVTLGKNELTYRSEVKVDATIMAFSQKKDQSLCDGLGKNADEGIQFDVTESTEGGNVICTVVAKGKPEKFADFSRGRKDKSELVRITKTGEKTYRIESEINLDPKADLQEMEEMMQAMFAGRNITWAITAPKIIETNGTLSEDKKSVSWSVPLSEAFKTPQKFYAVVQEESSWYDAIISFFAEIIKSIKDLFTSSSKPVSEAIGAPSKGIELVSASMQFCRATSLNHGFNSFIEKHTLLIVTSVMGLETQGKLTKQRPA